MTRLSQGLFAATGVGGGGGAGWRGVSLAEIRSCVRG